MKTPYRWSLVVIGIALSVWGIRFCLDTSTEDLPRSSDTEGSNPPGLAKHSPTNSPQNDGNTDSVREAVVREIRAKATTGAGQPLQGVEIVVTARPAKEAKGPDEFSLVSSATEDDGSCRVDLAIDRNYSVQAQKVGYLSKEQSVYAGSEDVTLTFVLNPVAAYGVTFFDPVHNRRVSLSQRDTMVLRDRSGVADVMSSASMDLLGAAQYASVSPQVVAQRLAQGRLIIPKKGGDIGPLECQLRVAGYAAAEASLDAVGLSAAINSPAMIMMEPAGGAVFVELVLRETTGVTPAGAQYVVVRPAGGDSESNRIYRAVDPAEPLGVMLPPGEYEAIYTQSKFDWVNSTTFTVDKEPAHRVIVSKAPGACLRVADTNTPRLPVFLRRLSRKRESAALEDVIFNVWPTTEKDIVLRGLSEGTYEVEAWFSTGAVVRTVNLVAGDEFVMKPRGS